MMYELCVVNEHLSVISRSSLVNGKTIVSQREPYSYGRLAWWYLFGILGHDATAIPDYWEAASETGGDILVVGDDGYWYAYGDDTRMIHAAATLATFGLTVEDWRSGFEQWIEPLSRVEFRCIL